MLSREISSIFQEGRSKKYLISVFRKDWKLFPKKSSILENVRGVSFCLKTFR
ncbi:hypothetical protein LBBP_01413 [Leptospira borgpetersenii serovar Ballum]|uniref:Uncharacterized protein n=1 Tax=Leptospira borgpetersenii serovar Ballum TaxID=280505 RepID=A0A0S2IPZ5_LEPBO|nr:hypothetical protein LBBP_01413 [Leptospira borgpetersenii serovar Ballum]